MSMIILFIAVMVIFLLYWNKVAVEEENRKGKRKQMKIRKIKKEKKRQLIAEIEEKRQRQLIAEIDAMKQKRQVIDEIEAKERNALRNIPNSGFGILKDYQVTSFSREKVDYFYADHEIVPPKPHSKFHRYYAKEWEQEDRFQWIFGTSEEFVLDNNDHNQKILTKLFLNLRNQLNAKYGDGDDDFEVAILSGINQHLEKFGTIGEESEMYKFARNKMKQICMDCHGVDAYNPRMLQQISPWHSYLGSRWIFPEGDISEIELKCMRVDSITKGLLRCAEERESVPNATALSFKIKNNLDLSDEEKKLSPKLLDFLKREERLIGRVCIVLIYYFKFDSEEIINSKKKEYFSAYRKYIAKERFGEDMADWDNL